MGADKAILVETDAVYDSLGIAKELEAAAKSSRRRPNPDGQAGHRR